MRMLNKRSNRLPLPLEDEPEGGLKSWLLGNHHWSFPLLRQRFLGHASSHPHLLASSASSSLLILDNILSVKKTSKWLMAIIELALPKVGNEEYQYRLSRHQGDTLWLAYRRCQRQPSSS